MSLTQTAEYTPTPQWREWAQAFEVVFRKTTTTPHQRRFYKTEAEATQAIEDWQKNRKPAEVVGKRKLDTYLQAEALLPAGVSLLDAVRGYLQWAAAQTPTTLGEMTDAYRKATLASCAAKYREEQDRTLADLEKHFGRDRRFSSILKKELVAYIEQDPSYWSRYARRRLVSLLIRQGLATDVLIKNPLVGYELKRPSSRSEKPIFTMALPDVRAFISWVEVNRQDLLPAFVLKLWAGIRTAELDRRDEGKRRALRYEDVHFGVQIEVPGSVAKMDHHDYMTLWTPALTAWWQPYVGRSGRICPIENLNDATTKIVRQINRERKALNRPALVFRQNAFRHTFGTAVAAYKDSNEQATKQLRQRDKGVFFSAYKGLMTAADAVEYFEKILPTVSSNVVSISA